MSGRVFGVGPGVFVLVFVAIALVLAVVVFSRTQYSRMVVLVSIAIYALLAAILFLTPRGAAPRKESPIGYDNVGVVRYLVLSLVAAGAVGALAVKGAITLLPERVAKRIDFHKDVLRIY